MRHHIRPFVFGLSNNTPSRFTVRWTPPNVHVCRCSVKKKTPYSMSSLLYIVDRRPLHNSTQNINLKFLPEIISFCYLRGCTHVYNLPFVFRVVSTKSIRTQITRVRKCANSMSVYPVTYGMNTMTGFIVKILALWMILGLIYFADDVCLWKCR